MGSGKRLAPRPIMILVFLCLGAITSAQPTDSVSVSVNPTDTQDRRAVNQLMPIVVGFVLTTLIGGLLAHHLQNRSWRYQRRETLRELHQAEATKIFDEVSRLLDRRHYRMSLVRWTLQRDPLDDSLLQSRWKLYRGAVFRWNDTVNRNRALIARYFGAEASRQFERVIGEGFVRYGNVLEQCYREKRNASAEERQRLDHLAAELNDAIWHFDDALVEQIRSGRVGSFQSNDA